MIIIWCDYIGKMLVIIFQLFCKNFTNECIAFPALRSFIRLSVPYRVSRWVCSCGTPGASCLAAACVRIASWRCPRVPGGPRTPAGSGQGPRPHTAGQSCLWSWRCEPSLSVGRDRRNGPLVPAIILENDTSFISISHSWMHVGFAIRNKFIAHLLSLTLF